MKIVIRSIFLATVFSCTVISASEKKEDPASKSKPDALKASAKPEPALYRSPEFCLNPGKTEFVRRKGLGEDPAKSGLAKSPKK